MNALKVLVVDDEPLARDLLGHLLANEEGFELMGTCANGAEAVDAILEAPPDLVLLDVQMPELDGFGVVEAVGPERMPPVVFVTAFDRHALRAFEVQALDYVLKPVDPERLRTALVRARRWQEAGALPQMRAKLEALAPPPLERLLAKEGDRHRLVQAREIQWLEAEGNYVRLHLHGRDALLRHTLSGLITRLDGRRFRRIHRSVAVNLDWVSELGPLAGGDWAVLMKDGSRLTLSRTHRDQFEELLPRGGSGAGSVDAKCR